MESYLKTYEVKINSILSLFVGKHLTHDQCNKYISKEPEGCSLSCHQMLPLRVGN